MALRKTMSIFKTINLSKSELILYNVGRALDSTTFVTKYKSILNGSDYNTGNRMLELPLKSFNKFPTTILLQLIEDSFKIVKEKGASSSSGAQIPKIGMYNVLLTNYADNGFSGPINEILQEMNQNKVVFNKVTYLILLKNYSNIGEMSAVEYLLEQMKSKNMELDFSCMNRIVTGYIMTGQIDKADAFITEHKLKETPALIISQGKGYASKGDVNNAMKCLRKLDNNALKMNAKGIFNMYFRLIKSKVPKSDLDELLQVMKEVAVANSIANAIFDFNRVGLFNDALQFLEIFHTSLKHSNRVNDIITSFNTNECPFKTYKQALTILLEFNIAFENIFIYMTFDKAYVFAEDVINPNNDFIVCKSLLKKAIYDKSHSAISDAVNFSRVNLKSHLFNMALFFTFIPSMLESRMVSNLEEMIDFLPQFQQSLLAVSLMYGLAKGNFLEVSTLKTKFKPKQLFFSCDTNRIAKEVVDNLSSTEIHKFAGEVSQIYCKSVLNQTMRKIVFEKVNLAAEYGNEDGIKKAVSLAETYQLIFSEDAISNLIKKHPSRAEFLRSLFEKYVSTTDININENVTEEPRGTIENQSETVS